MTKIALTKRYKTYPEHKNSGVEWVGKIPSSWDANYLRGVAVPNQEKNIDGKNDNLLSLSYGKIIEKDIHTGEGLLPASFDTYQVVHRGDIVLRLTDLQNDKKSLRVGFVDASDGIITSAYTALKLDNIDKKYAYYLLHSYDLQKVFYNMGGGVRQVLDYKNLKYLPVLLPTENEQKRIADFLDEKTVLVDRIIEKKQRLIELLKEKRAAVINHAVTKGLDPKARMVNSGLPWVGKIPSSWELVPNKVFLRKVKDQVGDQYSKFPLLSLTKQGVILRDTEENKGKFSADMSTFQIVNAGNLVFCLFDIQETPRTVGLSQLKGMITGAYSVFACVDPSIARFIEYFYIAMDDQKRLSYLYSGLRNTITPPKFLRVHTPIPPQETRLAIVDYIETRTRKIDAALCGVENSIRMLQEFKSSLISHSVTGKIHV